MTGTIINGAAIVIGGTAGLLLRNQIPHRWQLKLKVFLGVFTIYIGLAMAWSGLKGSTSSFAIRFLLVLVSMMLGNLTGRFLRIQANLNRVGTYAKQSMASGANAPEAQRFSEGFLTCTLLYCLGPMAILGSIQDGIAGDSKTLLVKSAMDGLATMAFAQTFGWGAILSALPVVAYQGTITLCAKALTPLLQDQAMLSPINATGGFLVCSIGLVLLEVRKIELANYLPSLLYAPLLAWLARWLLNSPTL